MADTGTYGVVAVGTTDTVILPADPKRNLIMVSNPTANNLWLAFGTPAIAGSSILIPPGALPYLFTREQIGLVIAQAFHGLFSTAAGNIAGLTGGSL